MLDEILMAKSVPENISQNLLGHKYGYGCTIIAYAGKDNHGSPMWIRQCDCGREDIVRHQSIVGKEKSLSCKECGDKRMAVGNKKDITGVIFGSGNIVLERSHQDKNGLYLWKYKCGTCKEDFYAYSFNIVGKNVIDRCKECSNKKKSELGRQNLIGYKWNGCEVLGDYIKEKHQEGKWKVRCRCTNEIYVRTSNIINDPINGCASCSQKEYQKTKIEDLSGQSFGKYGSKVIKMLDTRYFGSVEFLCLCGNCGNEFITCAKRIRETGDPIHVCINCAQKVNKRYGKEHWNYRLDLTEEDRILSGNRCLSEEYKKFHKNVLLRDNFKCVVCDNNKDLCVHHLDGFHWAIDKRADVDNGVTLCGGLNGCHEQFHSWYTKFNNTKQQFEDFVFMKTCYFSEIE